ncbi:MAG: ATP-binding protein, partial [candidate division NC10 bacterium]
FSRREAIAPRVLDVGEVVQGMAQMLRRLIGEDIELDVALGAGLWLVEADPHQLEQVVMNLAVNARDAMPHGGRLRVETANAEIDEAFALQRPGATAGPHVQLTVSDTGGGMDEATRARVFEPFFTTKEPGKGTGLGLSTVYGIVKQHGGYIEIDSAPNRGATFRMYLPRTEAPAAPLEPDAAGGSAAGGSETVLLVEDEAEVRRITHEILTARGYRVLEAGRPAEAVALLATHPGPIHLLVSDVVMPEMSGPQLAARLTAERPGLRVLFVSGYTADALGPRGALAPGVALLHKPFTAEALATKVRDVLDKRPNEVPGQA